jgi:hypothetical protein
MTALLAEPRPKGVERSADVAARRGSRDPQDAADILERQINSIAKVDRQALALREGFDGLPHGQALGVINGRRARRL